MSKYMSDIEKVTQLMFETSRCLKNQNDDDADNPYAHIRCALMYRLSQAKEGLTMKEISNFLGTTPSSATSLVNTLAKTGLLTRVPGKKDRRVVRVKLTTKGEKHLQDSYHKVSNRMKKLLVPLTKKELETFTHILTKLVENQRSNNTVL